MKVQDHEVERAVDAWYAAWKAAGGPMSGKPRRRDLERIAMRAALATLSPPPKAA